MVRIAVRTLTLNVYKGRLEFERISRGRMIVVCVLVPDPAMHRFILDCTATEYFSNLVWFIRNHVLDFDSFIRNHRE